MGNATKKKIKAYHILCFLLIIASLIQPLRILYSRLDVFFTRNYSLRYESLKDVYSNSQYVKKDSPGIIGDQALESFAAGAFLKGINPIQIIHDQPPLGRYILSASILFFDNPNTVMVPLLFLSAFGVFLVGHLVLKKTLLVIIPLSIFLNEPLFLNKFFYTPLLEPIQLPFIIFSLYFFMKGIAENKKYLRWFIYCSIMLGFVISIRFFALGIALVSSMLLYFLTKKETNKKFLQFILILPLSLFILFLSYSRTIQLGSSLADILGIQKYIYSYHKSQLSMPFSFWDLIIFNKWHTWWGTRAVLSDSQWFIFWPISMILSLIHAFTGIFKKLSISDSEKLLLLWIILYSLFLSLGETSTRYFHPLLPFLYIIATSFMCKIISKIFLKIKYKIFL